MDNKEKTFFKISEIDELRLIYFEILNGSSFCSENNIYIKHFTEKENYLLLKKRIEVWDYYSKEGVPHDSELLKNSIENGEWSNEKENKILELKYLISDNEKNIHNIIVQQRAPILKAIQKAKDQLNEILFERKRILGKSIEDLIDEDINDYISYISFYKDQKCKHSAFNSYEEFEKMNFSEIIKFNKLLSIHYEKFSEEKIKKIAAMPFFLNKFSYTKDKIYDFLGIPLNELSHNQISLFSLGAKNLNTLSNSEGNPPDLNLGAKPDQLVHWYDIQYSILLGKKKQSK